ncbi:MAG TPA: PQQ-binding-like beta-propeller repeat protein [Gaiellaceae bacterium]|nr:PQQ-binding-like beta-propeller repeat protein [Gaiellaceae bacterium]
MRVLAAVVAGVALVACGGGSAATGAGHDWTRFGWDARRSNDAPSGIAAADVSKLQRQQVSLPGTVDSSAIYLHGVTIGAASHDAFFVTTTYGITLAVDADSGAILWRWTPPGYSSWAGSAQITTATPVADPSRKWIYAASPDGRIQKLTVASGHAVWRRSITKLPSREKIAAALNLDRGHVIATTGGYIGDAPPYQGHVAILDARSGRLLHVWNSLCSNRHTLIAPASCPSSDSAIWGRAGAVVVPGSHDLLVATGNAPWNGRTDWGDAVVLLPPGAGKMIGNYTPSNTEQLNSGDVDLGSTSPVWLTPGLIAQGGKDGKIRLLSLARLRGTRPHRGGELQVVSTPSGTDLFTAPAVWRHGSRTTLIAADNGATQAWALRGGRLHAVWRRGTPGTSPVVAGSLVWVYSPGGGLNVYTAASGRLVATLPCGGGHWNSPIVADGRVALPEGNANDHATSGVLDIWR